MSAHLLASFRFENSLYFFTRLRLIQNLHVEYKDQLSVQVYHALYLEDQNMGVILRLMRLAAVYVLNSVHNAHPVQPFFIPSLYCTTFVIDWDYFTYYLSALSIFWYSDHDLNAWHHFHLFLYTQLTYHWTENILSNYN